MPDLIPDEVLRQIERNDFVSIVSEDQMARELLACREALRWALTEGERAARNLEKHTQLFDEDWGDAADKIRACLPEHQDGLPDSGTPK